MNYNLSVFASQYPIVQRFVQHLAYYRTAKMVYDKLQLKSPFWCQTIDAHIKMATIEWCKVFGADGCNATHWKLTAASAVKEAQETFRKVLYASGVFDASGWQKYHRAMLDLRNKYVAHHEIGFCSPVPDFDKALLVAYSYDDWVHALIHPDEFVGIRLREYYGLWTRQASQLVEKAMTETKGMKG